MLLGKILNLLISPWVAVPIFYVSWVMLLLIAKAVVFRILRRFTKKTENRIDDVFIKALRFPTTLLIFSSGAAIVERMIPWSNGSPGYFLMGFKAMTIVAVVLFVEKFLLGLIRLYADKVDILQSSGTFVRGVVRLLVYGLGLLALMDSFGISITPALASLGIGSLAVALSLQPTMENFFAGVQVILDKPVQIGQFVRLETGEEGHVYQIGWRSTWIRLAPNNVVIVPNKILTTTRITNFHYPKPEMVITVGVGVHYNSDLEQVERITLEVARDVMRTVAGGLADAEPAIRYHAFAASSIDFNVVLWVKEIGYAAAIRHEFIKRLHKRYQQEKIVIPYPIQAVNMSQEAVFERHSNAPDETLARPQLRVKDI